ncbi:MAG: beta-lactamase family protein [Gemmatimonadota bacterium]|nr:beta-lactamase family protein [Gemmatimonadota bacterium]
MQGKVASLRDPMVARVTRHEFPGAVWLVAQGDDVAVDAVGVTAIDGTAPMRRDTIFRIASMTKAVSASAVMMLVEDGTLTLDAPARRPITVQDLLSFTLGFGLLFDNSLPIQRAIDELQLVNGPPVPMTPHGPDEWMKRFGTLPLMHQPGERWMYNTGSLLQGVLVRRASGKTFEAFVHQRILAPLGMRDTDFFVPANKLDRFAGCGFFTDPQSGTKTRMDKDGAASAYATPPIFPSGAGGLVSTVDDYLVFARMLMKGGVHEGRRLLSAASVREMTKDQLTPEQKAASSFFPGFFDTRGWGYGMAIHTAPDAVSRVRCRYGWFGGFGTSWFNDPRRDLVAIVMTQSSDFLFNGGLDAFDRGVYAAAR